MKNSPQPSSVLHWEYCHTWLMVCLSDWCISKPAAGIWAGLKVEQHSHSVYLTQQACQLCHHFRVTRSGTHLLSASRNRGVVFNHQFCFTRANSWNYYVCYDYFDLKMVEFKINATFQGKNHINNQLWSFYFRRATSVIAVKKMVFNPKRTYSLSKE